MSKSKKKGLNVNLRRPPAFTIFGRKINNQDRQLFEHKMRRYECLKKHGQQFLETPTLNHEFIRNTLNRDCVTIEHQFIRLRDCIQLRAEDVARRYMFTKCMLTCLHKHHDFIYQAILYGSSVNGLGFRDSDIDLRLRPLALVDNRGTYEPVTLDEDMVERILRNIARQTTRCSPAFGEFVPSSRCPIAKLTFVKPHTFKAYNPSECEEAYKYDISLSTNPLSSFNSLLLRFLCDLEPKFHLLASALRYWSTSHGLIVPGHLSSYALTNMVMYFCQIIEPPLLPTIDKMRALYFEHCSDKKENENICKKGLTRIEWQCSVCFRKEFYKRSTNTEPLAVLLLKFFEFYLNFPYSTHIITTRPGRALERNEFLKSGQYDEGFQIKPFINIQDPFDLKHNLTSGMQGSFFKYFTIVLGYSYERLFQELLNNFSQKLPLSKKDKQCPWGLNVVFTKLTNKELDYLS